LINASHFSFAAALALRRRSSSSAIFVIDAVSYGGGLLLRHGVGPIAASEDAPPAHSIDAAASNPERVVVLCDGGRIDEVMKPLI
jgi:hypothetical protein